jgi:hypothetical protein
MTGPRRRAITLIVAGLLVLVTAFGASWAFAPDTDTVTGAADADNTSVLVGVQGPGPNGNVTALDGHGDVRWSIGDIISYQNVQRLDNGSVLATFAAGGFENCGPYDPPCKRTGVRIIDPGSDSGVADSGSDAVETEPSVEYERSYAIRTRKDSEVHDAEMLPSGNILVADMEWESIFVYDPKTGDRVWTWNASEHYDPPEDPTQTDWLHLNDADYIGDGRFLVSIRNMNQLLVVERGEGVVEVVNEDHDSAVLDKQHNPHWLGDGVVLVADSENHRVVELHENETSGEWEVVWSVGKVDGISLDWPRDVDRLPNGNTFITDSRNNRVVEVREDGSLVASYAVPSLPYEADREPFGEPNASEVEPYGTERQTQLGLGDREIPVISTLVAGARHVVAMPYWVSEIHLIAILFALGFWLRSGHLLVRGWRGKG